MNPWTWSGLQGGLASSENVCIFDWCLSFFLNRYYMPRWMLFTSQLRDALTKVRIVDWIFSCLTSARKQLFYPWLHLNCWPFQCWGYIRPKHKNAKIFEKHLIHVMLGLIGKLSLSTLKWVPICQGFSDFSGFFALFCFGRISQHQQHKG